MLPLIASTMRAWPMTCGAIAASAALVSHYADGWRAWAGLRRRQERTARRHRRLLLLDDRAGVLLEVVGDRLNADLHRPGGLGGVERLSDMEAVFGSWGLRNAHLLALHRKERPPTSTPPRSAEEGHAQRGAGGRVSRPRER